ncbi:MAG: phenylacetate-CoA ligase [Glaciecola sp.]|jgi:phenylacetate-CoA ligase
MKILEKSRYYSFWILDVLKGGKIKSHYKDIKFILEDFDSDDSKKMRDRHLSNLLNHAVKTTSFYNSHKEFSSIHDFPVVNKLQLRHSFDAFLSKDFKNKISFEVSTSGSTGTPFKVFQDKNKKDRNVADTIYFGEKSGYELGHKLFYLRAWSSLIQKNSFTVFFQNIVSINVKTLNDETISKLINQIGKGNSNKAFIGYPSAFREICKYLDSINSKPIKSNISSMIANAETLSFHTRKSVKKYFGFDILSRYSNMENGILSQQISNEGENFHINWASYYIEILDLEKDVPAGYGELGRVVVTDLFNYNMPLIRYDTGDLAVLNIDKNHYNGAPSFTQVEGRRMDAIYDTKGKLMTTVAYELEYFPELNQFQLIQETEKSYCVMVNSEGDFKRKDEMITVLKSFLGGDAIINIKYVNEVPPLSSGKRKLTVNNYKSQ